MRGHGLLVLRPSATVRQGENVVVEAVGDIDTIADLNRLPDMLAKRGYAKNDIPRIMHGNWIRFFSEVLPE